MEMAEIDDADLEAEFEAAAAEVSSKANAEASAAPGPNAQLAVVEQRRKEAQELKKSLTSLAMAVAAAVANKREGKVQRAAKDKEAITKAQAAVQKGNESLKLPSIYEKVRKLVEQAASELTAEQHAKFNDELRIVNSALFKEINALLAESKKLKAATGAVPAAGDTEEPADE